MKTCSKCKEEKDKSCFSIDRRLKSGFCSCCKGCININAKVYYAKQSSNILEKRKVYFGLNQERIKKEIIESKSQNRDRYLKYQIKYKLKRKVGEGYLSELVDTIFLINQIKQLCRTLNN